MPDLNPTELAVPGFVLLVLIEMVWAWKKRPTSYEPRDTLTSLSFGLGSTVAGLLTGGFFLALFLAAWEYRLFDIGWAWWAWIACFVLDDLAAADTAFSKVVELLGENGGLATAIAMGNRADVAAREGRIQDALDLFATSREHCQSMQAGNHVARLMVESAEALETGGLHDEARSELEQALPELEQHGLAMKRPEPDSPLGD